jgi:uncharacterized membrane protein YccC
MMRRILNIFISVLEYFIGGYLMFNGGFTIIADPDETVVGLMHLLYGTHIGLVIAGILVLLSGFTLVMSKIRKSNKWHGRGLFFVYLCYTFATVLNYVAYHGILGLWLGNAIGALVVGILWLRWKFKNDYLNPRHMYSEIRQIKPDPPPLP